MATKQPPSINLSGCPHCQLSHAIDPKHPASHETTFKQIQEKQNAKIIECEACHAHIKSPKSDKKPRVIKYPDK